MEPKLTQRTLSVLAELLHDPATPRYGLDLAGESRLGATTVYDVLMRLEQAGWATSEWESVDPAEAGRPRRRLYRLTLLGETSARTRIQGEIERLQRSVGASSGRSKPQGRRHPNSVPGQTA